MAERAVVLHTKKPEVKNERLVSRKYQADFSQSMSSPADRILFLQRTIGNQAVQRLIKSGTLQAKLRVGQPGDKYEQEADRVADAVMRMPEPQVRRQVEPEEEEEETLQSKPLTNQITPLVQLQRQEELEEEEELLQTMEISGENVDITPDLESRIQALRGGGHPLAESERGFFEPRFGYDFSQVRVHTDAQAAESAKAVNARAYTVGQDVVFGMGEYAPNITEGQKLFAHELTHAIQQSNNAISIQRQTEDEGSESEREKVLEFIKKKGVPSKLGAKVLEIIEDQIKEGTIVPEACVKASFERIKRAYTELGGTKFPPHGALEIFEHIWNSATSRKYWRKKFHKRLKPYKGKGAPGAVFYAGLGYIVPWKKIWTDLQPGAVLQLWKSFSSYKDVRNKRKVSRSGHSVIFVRYLKKGKTTLRRGSLTQEYSHGDGMLIEEQYGEDIVDKKTGKQVARRNLRWRYCVGANFYPLKTAPSEEATPLE